MTRVYLDWNARAPLRIEARTAMLDAMQHMGNPSSVHYEGRSADAIIEKARAQIADAFGIVDGDIVFTSGATEAAGLALNNQKLHCAGIEHSCVLAWGQCDLAVNKSGQVFVDDAQKTALQAANGETGVVQRLIKGLAVVDFAQAFGKIAVNFEQSGASMGLLSSHKLGGPAGIGALVLKSGADVAVQMRGGGQQQGRRSGTLDVIGIAGFVAAAVISAREVATGKWQAITKLRDKLEAIIADAAPRAIFFGQDSNRLPNTSCFAVSGWSGAVQVIQMDLAGFAISAGPACSSGIIKPSTVLQAMGYNEMVASSSIRVSLGTSTKMDDIIIFADRWIKLYRQFITKMA